ncbi:hypothetical protein [Prosthecobacter sp.]|uniref:ACP phosphodiesterase n=1 Tax=Prosthecobacter sp. TaxID=1965333 RepID=UPI003784514C
MNWLAHLYLSEPEVEFRVGNLLPDWVGPWEMVGLAEGFQRGIARHRRIDAFTDAHPVVRREVGTALLLVDPDDPSVVLRNVWMAAS